MFLISQSVLTCAGHFFLLEFKGSNNIVWSTDNEILHLFSYGPVTSCLLGAAILSNVLFPNTLILYFTLRIIFMPIRMKQNVYKLMYNFRKVMHLLLVYLSNNKQRCVQRGDKLISVCVHVDQIRKAVLWTGMSNGSTNNNGQWHEHRWLNATNVRVEK
jgi:hypothetical protein